MTCLLRLYILVIACILGVSSNETASAIEGCEYYISSIYCEGANWQTLPKLLASEDADWMFLSLRYNFLTTIESGSLPSGLTGIDFRNNPLLTIDPTAFNESSNSIHQLFFSDAKFTQIPAALAELNALTDLSIEDTYIYTWDDNTMKHIGLTLVTLKLDNVSLSSWPEWLQYFPHLQTLEMTCQFPSIPDNAFDGQADMLMTLTLINGNLTETPYAFSNISFLSTLVLDNNNISRLNSLPNSGSLSSFSITNNRLSNATHLSGVLRSVANSLFYLHLEGNQLSSFPDLSFMKKLLKVYLSYNSISDTSSGSIPTSVSYLEAENNTIRSLAGFLSQAANLEYLKLMGNLIANFTGDEIPSKVSYLDLSKNLITELNETSFPTKNSLGLIFLDYNPISVISPFAFTNLTKLISLSLKGTQLARLPLALGSVTKLLSLDMSESSNLVCTCEEKQVRSWYLSRPLTFYGVCGPLSISNFLNVLSQGC
ncbi:unnamed protein product [Candidula unifasciata]|uniref:Uncharacterized protein n=1 Tax=Candidula unifasciata TaxID=100452 RepID=A0A8S3ZWN4_9EUPU|nr:unnamed protein product [Candidula unifasciata]